MEGKSKSPSPVVLAKTAVLNGVLRFTKPVCIQGKFTGTIDATGELTVDKGAVVDADTINVSSISVLGRVSGNIFAEDKVDLCTGAEVSGDISARRLRIADGVLFEGQCSMVDAEKDIDIFSHSQDEIKDALQG
ncbi:MAG: polymer-forming cytoskeletal protein [Spirochaetaceae bacterium]|jgi:cytoskeletal protein CcmA (bactofilin family)|nr:polymer-forming cytoskeletal protein [Spirochaetaceae bacterium]